jgi:hypothetical protein
MMPAAITISRRAVRHAYEALQTDLAGLGAIGARGNMVFWLRDQYVKRQTLEFEKKSARSDIG